MKDQITNIIEQFRTLFVGIFRYCDNSYDFLIERYLANYNISIIIILLFLPFNDLTFLLPPPSSSIFYLLSSIFLFLSFPQSFPPYPPRLTLLSSLSPFSFHFHIFPFSSLNLSLLSSPSFSSHTSSCSLSYLPFPPPFPSYCSFLSLFFSISIRFLLFLSISIPFSPSLSLYSLSSFLFSLLTALIERGFIHCVEEQAENVFNFQNTLIKQTLYQLTPPR